MKTTNLKKLREQKQIKQKDMAKMLGYKHASNYNRVEKGLRGLPAEKGKLAAEILRCTLDDIFLTKNYPN